MHIRRAQAAKGSCVFAFDPSNGARPRLWRPLIQTPILIMDECYAENASGYLINGEI